MSFSTSATVTRLKSPKMECLRHDAATAYRSAVAGSASYNVAPDLAGYYFNKIQCFCFELQVLQPGERVMMPVSFFVEPEIVDDPDARFANTITLSYTLFKTENNYVSRAR